MNPTEDTVKISIRLPESLDDELRRVAFDGRVSKNAIAVEAIREAIEREQKKIARSRARKNRRVAAVN